MKCVYTHCVQSGVTLDTAVPCNTPVISPIVGNLIYAI